jgi:NADH-quinone oxidoreductase subunit J
MPDAAHTLLAAASTHPGAGEAAWFWLLAPVAFLAAVGLVTARSAVHAALFLAVDMLSLAVFYALQRAPFLAFVQVIVYTGAIMMLFLFVLMLVGVDSSDSLVETLKGQRVAAVLVGLGVAALLVAVIASAVQGVHATGLKQANAPGNVTALAELLFSRYVIAFEATSALLITAGLGAMVLAHRERLVPKLTQRDLMRLRFSPGHDPSPLPGPGVFARGDAVDRAALLPDGEFAANSVAESMEPAHTRSRVGAVEREIDDSDHRGEIAAGSGGKKDAEASRWT